MNALDINILDSFSESNLNYIVEKPIESEDKSIGGKPIDNKVIENSKTKGVIGKIGGIGADSNEPTRNGRRYPLELWQNVEKSEYFIEGMKNRTIIGEADHPQERLDYSVTEGAVVLTKYEIQNDGKVYTEFDILDTLPGRTVKTYFDAGCKLGVSSRGLGEEIMQEGEKIIDANTYQFYCFDVVAFPAVKSARMELIESTSSKKQSLINSITKEIKNCKSLDEVRFIESMSHGVDLYLDEIKEAIDIKQRELTESDETNKTRELAQSIIDKIDNKENKTVQDSQLYDFLKAWLGESSKNISSLLAQLKEDMTDGYVGKTWEDVIHEIEQDGYKLDSAYVSQKPQNEEEIILYKDGKSYTASVNKYHDGGFEILSNTIKEENNKIKISGPKVISDEDTPEVVDREPDKDLEILAELQEEVKSMVSKINTLNKQVEQKTITIKNLVAKTHTQAVKLHECANIFNELTSLKNENSKLQTVVEEKENQYSLLSKRYEKLQQANGEFSKMLESLNEKYIVLKDKNSSLIEQVESLERSSLSLKDTNIKLQESVNINKHTRKEVNQLNETINTLENKNSKLLNENKVFKSTIEKLENNISDLNENNMKLKNQCTQSLDKYIEVTCRKYNIKESTLKRLLGENYSIKDIDRVASEIVENMSKLNSLPFANLVPDRQIVMENVGLIENNDDSIEELSRFQFMIESKNK